MIYNRSFNVIAKELTIDLGVILSILLFLVYSILRIFMPKQRIRGLGVRDYFLDNPNQI